MSKLFFVIGLLILLMGIFWVGQGMGYIQWPANSFMISQNKWAYYGGGLIVIGILVMWFAHHN